MEYRVAGQPIRPFFMELVVPQDAIATAISKNRMITAKAFFFIAQCVFGLQVNWVKGLGARVFADEHDEQFKRSLDGRCSAVTEPVTIIAEPGNRR
jgi:hypothetical protein